VDHRVLGEVGAVRIGDESVIGPNTEIHGRVELGGQCRIGASAFIGTIKTGEAMPGSIRLGQGVRVGAGTILENESQLDLIIPDQADIPARSHVTNDGFGRPRYIRS
jgi:UDP-3-O-[3-hydroxymyristoyl] glucosamine N-acyltransferase